MAEMNERIRIARTLAGLSQDDVARALGVQRSVIVRYEQERKPGDTSLEKLASLTGFNVNWFWSKEIRGVFTFRPERPGQTHSHPQVRMKQEAMVRDWPRFLELLNIKRVLMLKSNLGGIAVAYNDQVCVVVIGTHSINTIRRLDLSTDISIESKSVSDADFLNIWMQPQYGYLKKILNLGETNLAHFSKDIPDGDYYSNVAQWDVELNVYDYVCDESISPAENDKELLNRIELALESCGVKVLFSKIKRQEIIISGTPEGWRFKHLQVEPEDEFGIYDRDLHEPEPSNKN